MDERVSTHSRVRTKRPLPARLADSLRANATYDTPPRHLDELPDTVSPVVARFENGMLRVLALARAVLAESECTRLRTLIDDAERCYAPGPPLAARSVRSPFTWWAYFDFYAGPRRRSLGELLVEVERELGLGRDLPELLERVQASRLGLYVHEGYADEGVLLRELITETKSRVRVVTGGYNGQPGEVWLARVLALPGGSEREIVATTPYVITEPGESKWRDFLADVLGPLPAAERVAAYERVMKRGLHRYFWNDFVSGAQVSQVEGAIFLAGLPLIARPASAAMHRPV